jgi:hypothetical protein
MTVQIAEGIMVEAMRITGLNRAQIKQRSRIIEVVQTRQAIMHVLRARTDWSWPHIARFVGLTDHSTAIHGSRETVKGMKSDPNIARLVECLMGAPEALPFTAELVTQETRRPRAGRRLVVSQTPNKEQFTMPVKLPAVKPKPVMERIIIEKGLSYTLNEAGECGYQRYMRANFTKGSKALAAAILSARASA